MKRVSKKTKNIFSSYLRGTLAFVMILSMFTNIVPHQTAKAADVVEIKTALDLMSIGETGSYKLMNDIDLQGTNWETKLFNGTLDGNGYTIKNAVLKNRIATGLYVGIPVQGLFYTNKGVDLKNITLENVNVEQSVDNAHVGLLLATLEATANGQTYNIQNIKVSNSHINTGTAKVAYVGGVVGSTNGETTTYRNIVVDGVEINAPSNTGGVGGFVGGTTKNYVSSVSPNIYNVLINVDITAQKNAGGFIGHFGNSKLKGEMNYIATYGSIEAIGDNVGGIVGYDQTSWSTKTMKYLYSNMSLNGNSSVGGLFGNFGFQPVVSDALFTGELTANTVVGGIAGTRNNDYGTLTNVVALPKTATNTTGADNNSILGKSTTTATTASIKSKVIRAYSYAQIDGNMSTADPILTGTFSKEEAENPQTYADLFGWDMSFTWGMSSKTKLPYLKALEILYPNFDAKFSGGVTLPELTQPDNLVSSDVKHDAITLSWDAVDGATSYRIERDGQVLKETDTLTVTDTNLTANKSYEYKVVAVDGINQRESQPSTITVKTTLSPIESPQNLKATSIKSSSVTLAWDAVDTATKYKVLRDGVEITSVTGTTYSDTGLTPDTTYKYEVIAVDEDSSRESVSSVVNVTTNLAPLDVPQNLTADAVTNSSVQLNWDKVDGANAYKIVRNGTPLATIYTNTYEINYLLSNTDYTFEVFALDQDNNRTSEPASVDVTTKRDPLPAPTNVRATDVNSNSAILQWNAVNGASEYNIIKDGQVLTTTTGTSFYLNGLTADTVYTYYVVAVDDPTDRESNATPVTFKTASEPLAIPQNVKATNLSDSSVTLTWNTVTGANSYKVYRDGQLLDTTSKLTFTDRDLDSSTMYLYQVVAVDSIKGRESDPASINVATLIGTPENFNAYNVTANALDLKWDMVNSATSYQVYRDGILLTELTGLSFKDNTVLSNTTYTYHLFALDSVTGQKSSYKELIVKTLPLAPTAPENFRLYGEPTSTNVVLNWDAVQDATKYTVKRDGVVIYDGTQQAYKETSELEEGKTYTYTVTASNAVGTSTESTLAVSIEVVKPDAPSNLKVTNVTDSSITISFDKVYGVGEYVVSLNGEDVEKITTNTYKFTGLTADTSYTIAVSSLNSKGSSVNPATIEAKTTLSPPTKVQNLKVTRVTPTTVNMQWDKLDTASEYEVYRDNSVLVYSGPLSTFQDTTVSPDTTYTYSLYGKNQYGKSAEANTVSVTTPAETQQIVATQPDTSSYNVTFDFKVVEGVSTYKVSRNPEWTYTSNGDGTYDVNSVNSVTGEEKVLGTIEETEDGYLPFNETLNGSEGSNLRYNIVGVMGTTEDGQEITTDPIQVDVAVPEASETPSNESSLNGLVSSEGSLSPAFSPSTNAYTVDVKEGVEQVTFVPTATDKNATITVNGIPVASGGTSPVIKIASLPQDVTIVVTGEDRISTTTYKVTLQAPQDTEEPTTPTNPDENTGGDGSTTEPTNPSEPSDGDNGETTEPTIPDEGNGDNGGTTEPTIPDEGNGDNGETTEPTTPDEGDNGSGEVTEPTTPDEGDNGETTEPTNPSEPSEGDNGNDNGTVEEPSNPTTPDEGDGTGTVEEPTTPSEPSEDDNGSNNGSNNENNSDSDKETDDSKQNNEESKSDDKSSKEDKEDAKSVEDEKTSADKEDSKSDEKSTDSKEKEEAKSGNALPNTANNFYNYLLVGVALIAVGLFFISYTKRRKEQA